MKLIIETPEGTQEVEYTKLALEEIEKRIRTYEQQYGSYNKFMGQYDCGSSSFEDSVIVMDWDSLLEEQKRRQPAGEARQSQEGNMP